METPGYDEGTVLCQNSFFLVSLKPSAINWISDRQQNNVWLQ